MDRKKIHEDLEGFLEEDRECEIPGFEKFSDEDIAFLNELIELTAEFS